MDGWNNWSGRHRAEPTRLHFLRSEEDAAALAAQTADRSGHLRAAGSGHSHVPLIPNDDTVVDTTGLAGVISADPDSRRAWVYAGTPIHALGRALADRGFALANQGDIDRQAIGGAVATGTHGTGVTLQNLSAAVTGVRIATAAGELIDCDAGRHPEIWQAARLNLGALGIITRVELQLRDAYRLAEQRWREPLDAVLESVPERIEAHRHFEFFWYPRSDNAAVKSIDEVTQPASYPLGEEGTRTGWSFEVLPNHRPHPHTEMEYSVPLEAGVECMRAIGRLLTEDFPDVRWPVEFRTLAADDVWLSTACGRPTVTISVHEDVANDETDYYRACEAVFRSFDGRPHWGKMHYLDGDTLAEIHPNWGDWWRVRNQVDPGGTFLNDYLAGFRPA